MYRLFFLLFFLKPDISTLGQQPGVPASEKKVDVPASGKKTNGSASRKKANVLVQEQLIPSEHEKNYKIFLKGGDSLFRVGNYKIAKLNYEQAGKVPGYNSRDSVIQKIRDLVKKCENSENFKREGIEALKNELFDEAITKFGSLLELNSYDKEAKAAICKASISRAKNMYKNEDYEGALNAINLSMKNYGCDEKNLRDSSGFFIEKFKTGFEIFELEIPPIFRPVSTSTMTSAEACKQYIEERIRFSTTNLRGAPKNMNVNVSFLIDASGKVKAVKVDDSILRSITDSATIGKLRDLLNQTQAVFTEMPLWTPGERKGKKVPVKMNYPIRFNK